MGRTVGIYPEIKDPDWHRRHGIDLAQLCWPSCTRSATRGPTDPAFVQCFDAAELVASEARSSAASCSSSSSSAPSPTMRSLLTPAGLDVSRRTRTASDRITRSSSKRRPRAPPGSRRSRAWPATPGCTCTLIRSARRPAGVRAHARGAARVLPDGGRRRRRVLRSSRRRRARPRFGYSRFNSCARARVDAARGQPPENWPRVNRAMEGAP